MVDSENAKAERKQINCVIDVDLITWLGIDAKTQGISVSECLERRLIKSFEDCPAQVPKALTPKAKPASRHRKAKAAAI